MKLFRIPEAALAEYLAGRPRDPRSLGPKPTLKYKTFVGGGKTYKTNGKQEVERRQRQIVLGQLYAPLAGPDMRHTESGTDAAEDDEKAAA